MRTLLSLVLLFSAIACGGGGGGSTPLAVSVWNQFRHDSGRRGAGGTSLGVNDGAIRAVLVDDPNDPNTPVGPISASPVIDSDGYIYAASESGTIRAFDPNDLSTRWLVAECCPKGSVLCNDRLGSISSTPAVYENGDFKTVIAASRATSASGRVYLIDIDELADPIAPDCRDMFPPKTGTVPGLEAGATLDFLSSPTFTINSVTGSISRVVIGARVTTPGATGSTGKVFALNNDGSLRWQYPAPGEAPIAGISASPTLAFTNVIYVATDDGTLLMLTQDGELKRRISIPNLVRPQFLFAPSASVANAVYIGAADGSLYAFNHDGSPRWVTRYPGQTFGGSLAVSVQSIPEETSTPTPLASATPTPTSTVYPTETATPTFTPQRATSNVFALSDAGKLIFLNEQNGAEVPPSGTPIPIDGTVTGSPVVSADLYVAFTSDAGVVYVVDSSTLRTPHQCEGGSLAGAHCVHDEDCKDGGACVTHFPVPLPGKCAASTPPTECRLDEDCGASAKCQRPNIRSSIAVSDDGKIFVGADDGKLYEIGPDGTPAPGASTPTPTRTPKGGAQ